MAEYEIINADVGGNSGEIKTVLYNTNNIQELTFNYGDNSATWKKYIPESLYIIGLDSHEYIMDKRDLNLSSPVIHIGNTPFLGLIKSSNAGTPEDKNLISQIVKGETLAIDDDYYPSCSIIDNYGYIIGFWTPVVYYLSWNPIKLNNLTYYVEEYDSRKKLYLFNHNFTSKIVKVPWITGNENISYIEDDGNNIKVKQILAYYPLEFVAEDKIEDFELYIWDYEKAERSEVITNNNISSKTNGFITNYECKVNTDNTSSLTLTFTCTLNNTGNYRDIFFIVTSGILNCTTLHIIQEPQIINSKTRVGDYEGAVYYLSRYYNELLINHSDRNISSPNYTQIDYDGKNYGITDFSGIFSVGHTLSSRIFWDGINNTTPRRFYLSDLGIKGYEGFMAIPVYVHDKGTLDVVKPAIDGLMHYNEIEELKDIPDIKWAGVKYIIYHITNSPDQTYLYY